ncbi:hypothetical protein NDU88_003982 [Pleurodeles waltl]|uniref:Uncharacterized protein n=1 Tax=Pleurodeles waltl TaxID=8319 RepID=A0AAV7UE53_PLEWA|nr:hypothetical protein NDU88_003982 [Pleurodeles waltl]
MLPRAQDRERVPTRGVPRIGTPELMDETTRESGGQWKTAALVVRRAWQRQHQQTIVTRQKERVGGS